jgi:hypothetical protein
MASDDNRPAGPPPMNEVTFNCSAAFLWNERSRVVHRTEEKKKKKKKQTKKKKMSQARTKQFIELG